MTIIERYDTMEALQARYPNVPDARTGPVYRYGGVLRVQIYMGQNETYDFNVDDPADVVVDLWGGEGTVCFGYGRIPDDVDVSRLLWNSTGSVSRAD